MDRVRIDKWLWAARFYKTRSLAADELDKGRVHVNGVQAKPAREVKAGDMVTFRQGQTTRTLLVRGISDQRGGAPVAQQLYEETAESQALRARAAENRRLNQEPAASLVHGRPTKRDRRDLDNLGSPHKNDPTQWGSRWSASVD